jgi:hypothetical protein
VELRYRVQVTARLDQQIDRALRMLAPCEREIVRLRFGIGGPPQALRAVARQLGLPQSRARRIELRAFAVLRGQALQAAAHWGNVLVRPPGRCRDPRGRTASPSLADAGPSRRVRHSNTR